MSEEQNPNNDKIVFVGKITVSISLTCCLVLIIIYFIYYLQVKFGILTDKESNKNSIKKSILEKPSEDGNDDKDKKRVGLGSNYMFLLILSNFIGGTFELILFISYDNGNLKGELCSFLGITHNFFELCAICWTTMLTYLFYCSTIVSHEIFFKETKYLIIGFLYTIPISLIFGVGPMINNYYGEEKYLCFFRYGDDMILFWNISHAIIIGLNLIFNCFFLFKTFVFYTKRAHILKKQNEKEYKQLLIYIWVFRIFPFVLILTAIIKGSSRVIAYFLSNESLLLKILGFSNVMIHNLNGFFNSMACFYFFRGVFWCCSSDNKKDTKDYITEIPETHEEDD